MSVCVQPFEHGGEEGCEPEEQEEARHEALAGLGVAHKDQLEVAAVGKVDQQRRAHRLHHKAHPQQRLREGRERERRQDGGEECACQPRRRSVP